MQNKSGNKYKIGHPKVGSGLQGLRISRLISRCQETTNNLKKGIPE